MMLKTTANAIIKQARIIPQTRATMIPFDERLANCVLTEGTTRGIFLQTAFRKARHKEIGLSG
jgi:hypothetical protein